MRFRRLAGFAGLAASIAAAGLLGSVTLTGASSHREAPYIATDPQADATDLYAFVSPENNGTVTLVANYVPLQVPPAGPNFYSFGNDVLYEINIDNNGDAIDDITYQLRFESKLNPNNAFGQYTFLYNTGPLTAANCNLQQGLSSSNCANLNQVQTATLSVLSTASRNRQGHVIKTGIPVAPANVGPKSYPNGYEQVAATAVTNLPGGGKIFLGPRDDPFFVDLGKTFDLLNFGGTPVDYVAGLNVHSIVLQVPMSAVTHNRALPTNPEDSNSIIGVRTTSHRQSQRVLRTPVTNPRGDTGVATSSGDWVQISRLDLPLINEVIIPLKDKDRWNGSQPRNDGQFLDYVTGTAPGSLPGQAAPHLGALIELVLGADVPAAPRNDLVDALLLGIPGLNRPANVAASSQLRLNLAVPLSASPARLGVLDGDLQGFPNGRRLTDDVVDIELAAIGGCLQGGAFAGNCALGDGVNANDKGFSGTFPYLASPHDYD